RAGMATRPLSSTTCSKFPRNIPLAGAGYPTNIDSTTATPHPAPQLPARILPAPTGCQGDVVARMEHQADRGHARSRRDAWKASGRLTARAVTPADGGPGGIGGAQRAQRASTARAPRINETNAGGGL